jgi:hypothetical protein
MEKPGVRGATVSSRLRYTDPVRLSVLLLSGCLFAPEVYEARLDELDDDDGDGWSEDAGDCDDTDPDRYPGAPEVCDEADNDCDGDVDDGISDVTGYTDADGDGFGDVNAPTTGCGAAGVQDATDCDDTNAAVNPGAGEHCDGADENCDGVVDEDPVDPATGFEDADGDGFGDPERPLSSCDEAAMVANDEDCDDTRDWVFPGAAERLDGVLNDCDGSGAADQVGTDDADVTLTGPEGYGLAVTGVADYTGDDQADLVAAAGGDVVLAIGPLRSGAVDDSRLRVSGFTGGLLGGQDLDGDGNRDFVYGRIDGLAIVDGNARGKFDPGASLTGAERPLWLDEGNLLAAGESSVSTWSVPVREGDAMLLAIEAPTSATRADLTGDGVDELIVGSAANRAVWILDHDATSQAQATQVTTDSESGSDFGQAVLVPGDVDADGVNDLVVAAPGADETGADDGRAWVFTQPATSTSQATGFVLGRSAEARCGATMQAAGDFDGDDRADFWLGGPGLDFSGAGAIPSVALYLGPIVGRTESRARAALVVGATGEAAGAGLSLSNTADADADATLAIGAPAAHTVYLFGMARQP